MPEIVLDLTFEEVKILYDIVQKHIQLLSIEYSKSDPEAESILSRLGEQLIRNIDAVEPESKE